MLIWGSRVRWKTLESGTFTCPQEQAGRSYNKREARRWFTLFWIPVIPMKRLGQDVECQSCKQSFSLGVI